MSGFLKKMIYKRLKKVLDKNKWKYIDSYDETGIKIPYTVESVGVVICTVQVLNKPLSAFFSFAIRDKIPEDQRGRVVEYLTYANFGLLHGSFEFDFDDGEIRYKYNMLFADGFWSFLRIPSEKLFEISMRIAFNNIMRYISKVKLIIENSNVSPKDICLLAEAKKTIEEITSKESERETYERLRRIYDPSHNSDQEQKG